MSNRRGRGPAVMGWVAGSLLALPLTVGCNVCAGSVCGDGNGENKVGAGSASPAAVEPLNGPTLPAAPSPPTKAQYIAAADAICARAESRAKQQASPELTAELLTALIQISTEMANEWRALTPPAGDAGQVDRFIEQQYEDIADVRRVIDVLAAGDVDQAQADLDQLLSEDVQAERRASAQRYGFRVCY
ncbi:hypothetical protein [Streptomyces lavendofoliae]|uniref:hypothetical protein n=1 Tax=Streptomyces lavendofoliae TaxID=67314 RepID=UPI003D8FF870